MRIDRSETMCQWGILKIKKDTFFVNLGRKAEFHGELGAKLEFEPAHKILCCLLT